MALGVAEKHISVADCIRVLVLVFLGNFAGALIFTALVYCSGQLDYSAGGLGAYTIKVAYGKWQHCHLARHLHLAFFVIF